jgi:hypothetical protein
MNFDVIKLFVQNKFTEVANSLYSMWCMDTPTRYFAIWLVTEIPITILTYFMMIKFDPAVSNELFVTVGFTIFILYTLFLMVVGIIHICLSTMFGCLSIMFGWLVSNMELAKRGIKVKADWKKDGV